MGLGKFKFNTHFVTTLMVLSVLCFTLDSYSQTNTQSYLEDKTDEVLAEISTEHLNAAENAFIPAEQEMGKFMQLLDDMSLSFSLSASLDLVRGFGIEAKYKYKVKPSYIGDSYSRIDRWVLQFPLETAKIFID